MFDISEDDPDYSENLLSTAKDLYTFAKRYPGTYSSTVPVNGNYPYAIFLSCFRF